jgi:dTDP-4-dehydrorhamnose 3,5-epimerase
VLIEQLAISGAYVVTPKQHGDSRGLFSEVFKLPDFASATGRALELKQANLSVSTAGTIRGVHFADVPPSQAKYIMCVKGALLDIIVDIRVGSPTFGQVETVLLDDENRRSAFLSEGLGHAFCALEDGTTAIYFCTEPYAPTREHGINPLDPQLGIAWPTVDRAGNPMAPLLSDKDTEAPSLAAAQASGLLPDFANCQNFYATLS